ncbi:MAG: arylesterase, partial [Hoeflea sp.]|nr:arylesterase [Hoeflea sp.]
MRFKGLPHAIAGLAGALVLVLNMAFAPVPAAAADQLKLIGFGDSLMAGYGLEGGEGFPARLQAALNERGHDVEIIDAGVSGDTTS